ncbi:MAG: hypothetical protein DRN68_01785 [Thaumarchaeota archaeon]|nr:MAG: hypothetical protein DRN68_01785 [Nitrososphaerota archaeon]
MREKISGKVSGKKHRGRKPLREVKVPLSVLVEPDLKKRLVELSLHTGEPMSNIVSDALKDYLARSGNLITCTGEGEGEGGGVNGP